MADFEDDLLWVDCKYERLPIFCYSRGKIDHYTTNCEEFPYKEPRPGENGVGNYGYWLQAEAREVTLFEKPFNGNEAVMHDEEELVPQTPTRANTLVVTNPIEANNQHLEHPMENQQLVTPELQGKGIANETMTSKGKKSKGTQLSILDSLRFDTLAISLSDTSRKIKKSHKSPATKKIKRNNLHDTTRVVSSTADEALQLDTPVLMEEGG